MQQKNIPGRLSEAATAKVLWSHSPVNGPEADRYMRLARKAESDIIGTPSAGPSDAIAKLALLLDWESETLSASSRALIQSVIADLEGCVPVEMPATPKPPPKNKSRPVSFSC